MLTSFSSLSFQGHPNLTFIQRFGYISHTCKMVYCQAEVIVIYMVLIWSNFSLESLKPQFLLCFFYYTWILYLDRFQINCITYFLCQQSSRVDFILILITRFWELFSPMGHKLTFWRLKTNCSLSPVTWMVLEKMLGTLQIDCRQGG